jgi:hypothetical protein
MREIEVRRPNGKPRTERPPPKTVDSRADGRSEFARSGVRAESALRWSTKPENLIRFVPAKEELSSLT